jgi:hypothetical protein
MRETHENPPDRHKKAELADDDMQFLDIKEKRVCQKNSKNKKESISVDECQVYRRKKVKNQVWRDRGLHPLDIIACKIVQDRSENKDDYRYQDEILMLSDLRLPFMELASERFFFKNDTNTF